MTLTPDQLAARRLTNGRILKIAGATVALLFAISLVGACGTPAASTTSPTQAPVAVVATATTQPQPTARPTDVAKPTAAPPTQAPQPTVAPAKPTQAPTQAPQPTTAPAKPTAAPTQAPAPTAALVKAAAISAGVAPKTGECPDDHPIKGNASSKIYHRPGGASYTRTKAEECFDTPASAQAAGYRAAAR